MSHLDYPMLRRSRDYHVYTLAGKRLLDLHRADGQLLLGHSLPGMATAVKAMVDRHLLMACPHTGLRQAVSGLAACFPGHCIRIYPSVQEARSALEQIGIHDGRFVPSLADLSSCPASRWQVWLPFLPLTADNACLVLPGAGIHAPCIVLRRGQDWPAELPPSLCSPLQSAALLQVLPYLQALGAFPDQPPTIPAGFRLHADTLGTWRKGDFDWLDRQPIPDWERHGPYLAWKGRAETWPAVWQRAIETGVLLNPDCRGLVYLPGHCSRQERESIALALSAAPEV